MIYGGLFVDDYRISRLRDGVTNELLAAFRDDMYRTVEVSQAAYWNGDVLDEDADKSVIVHEFVCDGRRMIDRLDIIGCTLAEAKHYLQDCLDHSRELARQRYRDLGGNEEIAKDLVAEMLKYEGLDAYNWIEKLKELGLPEGASFRNLGRETLTSSWLGNHLDYWDERYALRLVLEAFPDSTVRLDMTEMVEDGAADASLAKECSNAALALQTVGGLYSPVVVLTEGRSDSAILSRSLKVLYPHLSDLIRFMDYSRKPEGGAGALVSMVRAFASAGIANRLIFIFDNDSAAAEALMSLDTKSLPSNIQVLQYPDYDLARQYPTLGPATLNSPDGGVELANVNALAGSIELYLGVDVLTQQDGELMPVQWRSYVPRLRQYQGVLLDKAMLQERFELKATAVENGTVEFIDRHWEGLRLVLDLIKDAIARF